MSSKTRSHKSRAGHDFYRRRAATREPYDSVLIVCEGEKTEPNYLKGVRDDLSLSMANIEIVGFGVDPLSLVDKAITFYNNDKYYDSVYCVFDKDAHPHFNAALHKINDLKKNSIPIYAITSVPCFEYWLLLHFEDSMRPYAQSGKKFPADQVFSQLKQYIKNYNKGHHDIFSITKEYLYEACKRSKRILKQQNKHQTDNPSTNFHELVNYLQNIKK